MKKSIRVFITAILIIMLAAGCGSKGAVKQGSQAAAPADSTAQAPLTKVTVMLDWTPNTNHTGLYVAKEKGFFKEQGLDVDILQSGDPGPAQLVAAGKVDFGVSYQEQVTNARAENVPIVSLAAVIQHNTSGFASLKKAGLTSPKNLEGKRYGGWGAPEEQAVIEAVMAKDGGDWKKVKMVDIGEADFFSIIGKKVDFTWIFYGWDGIQAELKNMPLNIIMLKDFDPALDYYTPVLITSEKMIQEKPELAKKFMAAVSKGYEFSIANPDESAGILLKAAPELNADLVKASQKYLAGQYQAEASQWGWQKKEVWSRYTDWMLQRKLISKSIDVDKAFTNDFLPKK